MRDVFSYEKGGNFRVNLTLQYLQRWDFKNSVRFGEFGLVLSLITVARWILPKWRYHFAFPSAINESSCCSTSLPAFGVISVLAFSHSSKCVLVSHCFNLQFPNDV